MKWTLKFFQMGIVCLLAACGGGGGGGGGGEDRDSGSNSTTSPQQVSYSGKTNQALLSQANGMRMASNTYALLDLVVMLANLNGIPTPWFLGAGDTDTGDMDSCTEGEMLTLEQGSDVIVRFRRCVIDGTTFDGELTFRMDVEEPADDRHTMIIPYLSIEDAEEKLELSGEIQFEYGSTASYAGDLIVRSRQQQRTFQLKNLLLQGIDSVQVAGQFYDSVDGFVSLGMESDGARLMLTGASASRVAVEIQASSYAPDLSYETPVAIELQNSSLVFPVQALVSLEQLGPVNTNFDTMRK